MVRGKHDLLTPELNNWIDVLRNHGMQDTLQWEDHPIIGREQFGLTLPAQAFGLGGDYRFEVHVSSPHGDLEGETIGGGGFTTPMFRWFGEGDAPNGESVILLQELLENSPESSKGAEEMAKKVTNFYKAYKNQVMDTMKQIEKPIFEE